MNTVRFSVLILAAVWLGVMLPAQAKAAGSAHCPLDGDLVITSEDAFFPYAGVYDHELRGFAVDIVRAAYQAAGCDVEFATMPYNRCVGEVSAGSQIGCFNTTNSAENLERYIFHQVPLFKGRIRIYAHPDQGKTFGKSDFRSGRFAVVLGYTYTDAFDADPDINKTAVESDLQTLALVPRRRTNYAVVYEKVAQYHISRNAALINPAPVAVHTLVEFDLFVSFSRKFPDRSTALAELLDDGLRRIQADGTYAAIEQAWDQWLTEGIAQAIPPPYWTGPAD